MLNPWPEFLDGTTYKVPCRENPALFDPEVTKPALLNQAKKICSGCALLKECRAYAQANRKILIGTWGGMTQEERASPHSGRRPPCGTPQGYRYHLKHKDWWDCAGGCREAYNSKRNADRRRAVYADLGADDARRVS